MHLLSPTAKILSSLLYIALLISATEVATAQHGLVVSDHFKIFPLVDPLLVRTAECARPAQDKRTDLSRRGWIGTYLDANLGDIKYQMWLTAHLDSVHGTFYFYIKPNAQVHFSGMDDVGEVLGTIIGDSVSLRLILDSVCGIDTLEIAGRQGAFTLQGQPKANAWESGLATEVPFISGTIRSHRKDRYTVGAFLIWPEELIK